MLVFVPAPCTAVAAVGPGHTNMNETRNETALVSLLSVVIPDQVEVHACYLSIWDVPGPSCNSSATG
jgi:hypothetical protein